MASYNRCTSGGGMTVATAVASPTKSQCGSGGDAQNGGAAPNAATSPKGGQCLCSPTTHQGSFRCKFHRSNSAAYFKRSKSMPMNQNNSPKSVESS